MKLRLAVFTIVLGLSASGVTAVPAVADAPSGFVNCRVGFIVDPIRFDSGQELGQAVVSCLARDGKIVSIQFGGG